MTMPAWSDALLLATLQWEAVIRHLGWPVLVVAAAYVVAAVLCYACGSSDAQARSGWYLAAAVLTTIAVTTITRIDLLLVYTLRALARAGGWYQERREWQALTVGVLVIGALVTAAWLRTRLHSGWTHCAAAVLGVGLLAGLFGLRAISFHFTDRALAQVIAGISVGRLLEFAGLGLTTFGALRWVRGGRVAGRV